ncbi:DUF4190 domain-containing protein [Nocardiopsis flavescens]|uniref:DUF4190 domain-containing protein n=1 Tax=Nocardiopsis flavescens TaxID=758803 RepID=A0A1M6G093_9ACTN|nr:hypothetical protein [Nocardiopsis flavescens]SHJ03262.1 hypothetical protein SAMN05421803_103216 [Nocardiopsis flavescens]
MTENRPEPRSEDDRPRVERGGLWGLFFGLAGLLLPPYGGVLSAFGLVQGIQARRAARRNRSDAPLALLSVAVGVAGVVVSLAMIAVSVVFNDQLIEYRDCSARAHTVSTQQACDDAWNSGTALPSWVTGA